MHDLMMIDDSERAKGYRDGYNLKNLPVWARAISKNEKLGRIDSLPLTADDTALRAFISHEQAIEIILNRSQEYTSGKQKVKHRANVVEKPVTDVEVPSEKSSLKIKDSMPEEVKNDDELEESFNSIQITQKKIMKRDFDED